MPHELVEAMKRAGIFGMTMPKSWGGPELDPLTSKPLLSIVNGPGGIDLQLEAELSELSEEEAAEFRGEGGESALGEIVRAGHDARNGKVEQAEAIVSAGVKEFMNWLDGRKSVPTVRALRDHAERLRRHEMEKAHRRLGKGEDPQAVLEALSQGIMNKLLHDPTHALNQAAGSERDELIRLLSRLYNLHGD